MKKQHEHVERPQQIYLDQAIELPGGIKIQHTEAGLRYLVEHYSLCLAQGTDQQIKSSDRDHLQRLIERLQNHISFYESGRVKGAEKV